MNHKEDCCCPCCQIPRLEKTIAEQAEQIKTLRQEADAILDDLIKAAAQNQPLKEFAHSVIKQECWGYDVDGAEIQELAEKLGFIKEHIATKEDVNEFTDYEVGDKIYKFTDILKGQDNEYI